MKKIILILIIFVIIGGAYFGYQWSQNKKSIGQQERLAKQPQIKDEYNNLSLKYQFKYKTYEEAVLAFKKLANSNKIIPDRISFYVPGKTPREDGNPYFIGFGELDISENKCIRGYINLVTGEGDTWQDVCFIIN